MRGLVSQSPTDRGADARRVRRACAIRPSFSVRNGIVAAEASSRRGLNPLRIGELAQIRGVGCKGGGHPIASLYQCVTHPAGMAKLADAADLKSADPKGLWGFDSPSRHQEEGG